MSQVSDSTPRQRPALQHLTVTRPAAEAARWVESLQTQGWPALALPLIEVGPPRDAAALKALAGWRAEWARMDALFFVSGAAVQHFFEPVFSPSDGLPGPRFWAPGPGTARALIERGVDPSHIDSPAPDAAQFDSESLWAVVAPQVRAGSRILIVRGHSEGVDAPTDAGLPGSGRDWLIRQCQALGAEVHACVAYERHAPDFSVEALALMQRATRPGSLWLFSSSEALANLQRAAPTLNWRDCAALVTHPRIADAARGAGFGRVVETRPALPDVLRTLESEWSKP